jgi:hypothetical protein
MQADEGQGPETQQGIGSLGPEPMQQQMPTPNRMGAEYGGRIGFQRGSPHSSEAADAYSSMVENDESTIMKKIQFLMSEHGLSKEEAFERVIPQFRRSPSPERPQISPPQAPLRPKPGPLGMRPPRRIGGRLGGDMEELSMRETIDTPEGIETLKETDTMQMAGGGARGWKAQMVAEEWAWDRYGMEFYDLSQVKQIDLYSEALDFIDSGGE